MKKEEEIVAMYRKGFGADRICDALDVCRETVYSALDKHNIPRRHDFTVEWRKLRKKWHRKGYSKTLRVVTIPRKFIEEAGFDPHSELEGKWEAKGGYLILHIREVGARKPVLSRLKRKMFGGEGK